MGYFLWLNASINTTNVAKEIANINDSNTVIGTTPGPHDVGHADIAAGSGELSLPSFSEPTTLESPILLLFYYSSITLLLLFYYSSITLLLYHTYVPPNPNALFLYERFIPLSSFLCKYKGI